ncbi:MAG: hypothetical protein AAFY17_05865, partial [Cyanobacteria bacterium J06642_11]
MRDIARNFRALPLVSWMVWIAMAVIAAPVMALPTAPDSTESGDIAVVSASVDQEDSEADPADADQDAAEVVAVDGLTANTLAVETADSHPILLSQESSGDLANPSDPFDFDGRSVEEPRDGALEPLSETEDLPTSEEGEIELEEGPLTPPQLKLQTAAIQEGDEFSARARVYGHYFLRS